MDFQGRYRQILEGDKRKLPCFCLLRSSCKHFYTCQTYAIPSDKPSDSPLVLLFRPHCRLGNIHTKRCQKVENRAYYSPSSGCCHCFLDITCLTNRDYRCMVVYICLRYGSNLCHDSSRNIWQLHFTPNG